MFPIYPYHNIEDFNLDWIIKLIKKLEKEVDTFTALTKITWAGEWDITRYYTQWSLVDDNGNGYISIKPVPRNVPITDTNYWVLVADYSALYAAFSQRITDLENAVDNINTEIPTLQGEIDTINNTTIPNAINSITSVRPYVTPKMFGAVGDGVTDDTQAVQDAIDMSTTADVVFTSGNYLVTTLALTSGLHIIGRDATITQASNTLLFDSNTLNDVTIKGVTFVNYNGNDTPTIFKMSSCNNVIFENCHFIGNDINNYIDQGVIVFDSCTNTRIINCEAENAQGEGLYMINCVNCTIKGGTYHNMDNGSGIVISHQSTRNVIIDGVEAYACAGSAINLNAPYSTAQNCYIHDTDTIGINLSHNTADTKADYSQVLNCIILNTGHWAINTQSSSHVSLIGNYAKNNDNRAHNGIRIDAGGDYGIISNNKVHGFDNGIVTAKKECIISNNIIGDCNSGIYGYEHYNSIIENNLITYCNYGIYNELGHGNNNIVSNNRIINTSTYGIYDAAYDYISNNFITVSGGTPIAAGASTLANNIIAPLI